MNLKSINHQIHKYRILYYMGAAAVVASIVYAAVYGAWFMLFASYLWGRWVGLLGNQIALHRYFAHRSFKTTPIKHHILLWFSILGGEGSPITWAIHHRHHHKYAETDRDIHSPYESIWLATVGWQVKPARWWLTERRVQTVPRDLMHDHWIKWVDRHYYNIWLVLILLSLAVDWRLCVFFVLAPVGHGIISGAILNWFGHWQLPGSYRSYATTDKTYNNQAVAWYLGGEGLHNNHHHDTSQYNQAFNPGEFDFGGWLVKKFLALPDKSLTTPLASSKIQHV